MSGDDQNVGGNAPFGNGAPATPPSPPEPPPPAPAAEGWNVPPSGGAPPPPPPSDATGQVPAPKTGGGINLAVDNPVALGLGAVAVIAIVLGIVLKGDTNSLTQTTNPQSFWTQMGWTWAVLAIVAAATALLPVVRTAIGLSRQQAASIMAIGAGVLALEWVLFVLPQIASNRAFLITLGVLAAGGAAWLSRPGAEAD